MSQRIASGVRPLHLIQRTERILRNHKRYATSQVVLERRSRLPSQHALLYFTVVSICYLTTLVLVRSIGTVLLLRHRYSDAVAGAAVLVVILLASCAAKMVTQ
eukprot:3641997-Amphidinium_carterae.1